jgi:sulfocyanin
VQGVKVCPGDLGGYEYSPPAYSPATQLAYEPGMNNCDIYKLAPQIENNLHTVGAIDLGGSVIPTGTNSGYMVAIDTRTGKVAWNTNVPAPMVGGALATAGGLVFSGAEDGSFYGFNSSNGKVLWKTNVGLSFGAAPLTYQVNGTQYVAVATGGAAVSAILGGKVGGTLAVFKLNGTPVSAARFPAAKALSFLGNAGVITTKGLTKINPWMFDDPKTQTVTIVVTAAQTADNSGFNFDGYDKGKATFVVPAGWKVNWIFTNKAALPHSAALIQNLKTPSALTSSLGTPIATPNAMQGVAAGKTQYASFSAVEPGNFFMACLVPGHITAGMWDNFIVSTTAKAPSLQIK